MTETESQRWLRIAELFDAAVDLPANARTEFVAAQCVDDAVLAARLHAMLAADAEAQDADFLGKPVVAAAIADWDADENDYAPGSRRFGPYRLLHPIGRGGMGEVHLAERDDGQFEQRVALKLLPHPTPGLIARFRRERQIVARLEHPHIARLLDGGVGEANIPYFAMEFVDGRAITRFVADERLDVRATLRLFLDVCDAVAYAHRNLVVHRDLKPSNILVGADGVPKLLDFGIAKVLDATDDRAQTRTQARAFTPDYAAPEQIRGEAVTTAVDVYALGVVLYELLTGTRPYKLKRDQVLEQAILSVEPVAPSHAIEREAAAGNERRRAVRGDLDRIVLHALAKEPNQRYATVEAFADDIRRRLDGRPVAARGDGAWYRARKFVRRHAVACVLGAAAVLLLISATAFSLRQARIAEAEAQRAAQKSNTAEAVKDYLLSVFASANPYKTDGKTITARDLLEGGLDQVEKKLAGQPQVQAEVYADFVETFRQLGQDTLGKHAGELALTRYRQFLPPDAIEILQVESELAQTDFNLTLFDGLSERFRNLLARAGNRTGKYAKIRCDSLIMLAEIQFREEHYEESIATGNAALELLRTTSGKDYNYDIGITIYDRFLNQLAQGRIDAAAASAVEFTSQDRLLVGPQHPGLITDVWAIGRLMENVGRLRQARELFSGVLAARRRQFVETHAFVVQAREYLAQTERELGNVADSERALTDLVALVVEHAQLGASDLASLHAFAAQSLIETSRLDDAQRALAEADRQIRRVAAADSPVALAIAASAADIERRRGNAQDASAKFDDITARQRERDDRELPATLLAAARAQIALGKPNAAAPLLAAARETLTRQGRPASTIAREIEIEAAQLAAAQGQPSVAAAHWNRAARIGCINFGCDDARVAAWTTAAEQAAGDASAIADPPPQSFESLYAMAQDVLKAADSAAEAKPPGTSQP